MVKVKWLSLERHVHNVHSAHGEPFLKCAHGELEFCSKKWFKRRKSFAIAMINILSLTHVTYAKAHPLLLDAIYLHHYIYLSLTKCVNISVLSSDTKASEKLTALLTNPVFLKDLTRLSPCTKHLP